MSLRCKYVFKVLPDIYLSYCKFVKRIHVVINNFSKNDVVILLVLNINIACLTDVSYIAIPFKMIL